MEAGALKRPARTASARALAVFFLLAFAGMWVCFGIIAADHISTGSGLGTLLVLLGVFAPALAGLGVTAYTEGAPQARALVARVAKVHVSARWYVVAIAFTPAIKLTAALVHRIATGAWPRFGHEAWVVVLIATLVSTPVQAGEEIGWRGYALPRLASRVGLANASLLLGVIWALWHLPQFFIPQADTFGQSFTMFILQVVALSVALAWLYARTGGSLLLVMLMHSAFNNLKDIVPSASPPGTLLGLHASLVGWTTIVLLWVAAAWCLAHMPVLEAVNPQSGLRAQPTHGA